MYSFVENMDALELQISAKRPRVPKLKHSQLEDILPDDLSNDTVQDDMKKKNKVRIFLLCIILIVTYVAGRVKRWNS